MIWDRISILFNCFNTLCKNLRTFEGEWIKLLDYEIRSFLKFSRKKPVHLKWYQILTEYIETTLNFWFNVLCIFFFIYYLFILRFYIFFLFFRFFFILAIEIQFAKKKKKKKKKDVQTLNIDFWVLSTYALKIWDRFNENWSSYQITKWYLFFWNTL